MGKVINITYLQKVVRNTMMYEKIINELINSTDRNYSINFAEKIADDILTVSNRDKIVGDIPIVKIVEEFGFKPYAVKNLKNEVSGNIYIGGTTKELYGQDKIMVVGYDEEYFHQRFILAHELGHYLFDYLGNKTYENSDILYSAAYIKTKHDDETEKRADRFAAELLMPAKLFLVQFIKAMNASDDNMRYVLVYLSNLFKTKQSSVKRRIEELGLPY